MKSFSLWKYLSVFLLVILFSSCEKNIDLNIQGDGDKLVVQAFIERQIDPYTGDEQGIPPIVVLTKSISFFGDVDSATLANIFIHDADVYISDGTQEIKLKEYDFRLDPDQPIRSSYFYTLSDTSSNLMVGEFGKTYTLRIEWNGETYTSTSTLIPPVPVDSFWVQQPKNVESDTPYYEVRAQFSDPIVKPQYYYYRVNSIYQNMEFESYEDVFNDEVTNGVSYKFTINATDFGSESTQQGYYIEGDSLILKWSSIDYNAFEFFNTKSFSQGSVGNPFATPVNVIGNISNGGLGAFITYGSYLYQMRIEP